MQGLPVMAITGTSRGIGRGAAYAARFIGKQTLYRAIKTEAICHVIEFLASPLSSGITGQIIRMGLVEG